MQKLKSGLVMAACLAGVLSAAIPGTATATVTALPGNSGYISFWDDHGYKDTKKDFAPGDGSENLDEVGFGDKASSFVNKTSIYWLIYEHKDRGGRALCVRPNSHMSNMDDVSFGDKMSSVHQARGAISSCNGATAIGAPN